MICGIGIKGKGKHEPIPSNPIYTRWRSMIQRCHNPNNPNYQYYGAKGVQVLGDFQHFQRFADWFISECKHLNQDPFTTNYQIDKDINSIDGYGQFYCPENCTLISPQRNTEQAKAKTYHFISPEGEHVEVHNLHQFCLKHNLTHGNMFKVAHGKRKHHKGWSLALSG